MFSYIHGPESLNTFLSQGCTLGSASGSRAGKRNAHSKDRKGVRSLQVSGFSSQANWWSHLLGDLSQQGPYSHSHFIGEKTDAQKGSVTCPESHMSQWWRLRKLGGL